MIRILKKHILKEFIGALCITTLAFVTLFLLVDIVERVDDLIEHNVPLWTGVYYFLYKVPFIFCQVSPVAVLLAVLISLGTLNKYGEITSIKAGGISLMSALSPLFVSGILISAFVIIINESLTPVTNKLVDSIERRWVKGMEKISFGREGLWLRSGGGIYNIREIDLEKNMLNGVTLYKLYDFLLEGRTHARMVEWEDGSWVAKEATGLTFRDGSVVDKTRKRDIVFQGLEGPEDLVIFEKSYEDMSFMELKHYIRGLEKDGYKTYKYRVELYDKFTFPLVNFIMVLVGIPFALRTGRHGGIALGVGLSVVIGFSYWIIFGLAKSLGQIGILPPIVAATFPDVLFVAIGALMFGYVRQ
jgi:lipopolysaccharide export system permease protein